MSGKRIELDEEAFAADWASGMYTQGNMAARYGVSLSLVKKITSGRRRPALHARIEEVRKAARRRTERGLIGLLDQAVETLKRAMAGEATATALAAAKEVLNRAMGRVEASAKAAPPTPPPVHRPVRPTILDLSPELKRQVLIELGGPVPGEGEPWEEEVERDDDDDRVPRPAGHWPGEFDPVPPGQAVHNAGEYGTSFSRDP